MKITSVGMSMALFVATFLYCHPSEGNDPQREVQPDQTKEEVVVSKPMIEIQSASWCGPCRKLKASGAIQELKDAGWDVKFTSGWAKSYPSFRVTVGDNSEVFSGYSSKSGLFKRIKAAKERLTK